MDRLNELESKIIEIRDKYENSDAGYLELQEAAREIDELRSEVQKVFQEYDSSMHRNENGQFQKPEYDISELAEFTTKVNEVDDLCYDISTDLYATANKKQIMYEGKEFRRNQIRSLARYYELRIQNTRKQLDELIRKNPSKRNSTEIDIYNIAIEKYQANYDELSSLAEELNSEMDLLRNGGEIDYDKFYESSEKAIDFMEGEGLLREEDIEEELEENLSEAKEESQSNDIKNEQSPVVTPVAKKGNKRKNILDQLIDKEKEFDVYRRSQKESSKKDDEIKTENLDDIKERENQEKSKIDETAKKVPEGQTPVNDKGEELKEPDKKDSIVDISQAPNPHLNVPEDTMEKNKEGNKKKTPIVPKRKSNKPKLTWKTYLSMAAGVGLGATVFFTTGPAGVGIMMIAGSIAKKIISNQEKKISKMTSINGPTKVSSVKDPSEKMMGPIGKLKSYLKSPEGLRDMRWMINAAMITGAGLTIGQAAQQFIGNMNQPIVEAPAIDAPIGPETITQTAPTPTITPEVTPPNLGYEGIRLGDSIGNYNVTTGYDSATWALNGQNAEVLNTNIINSANSQFGRFRVYNPDGTRTIIDSVGTSVQDLINQGYSIDQIAIDVMSNGESQAWVNITEIMNGGKGL